MNPLVLNVLLLHAGVLAVPCILGVVLARFGDGRLLWVAALTALVLSLIALHTYTSAIGQHTYDAVNALVGAFLTAEAGALIAVGTCASALVRAWRNKQVAWFLALLVSAVLPLLAMLAVFEYTEAVVGQIAWDPSIYDAGEQLAAELLPIGSAVLLVYGLRLAVAAQRSSAAGVF